LIGAYEASASPGAFVVRIVGDSPITSFLSVSAAQGSGRTNSTMTRVDPVQIDQLVEAQSRRRGTAPGVVVGVIVAVLLGVLGWRMVPHPVGAARTYGKYRGKSVTTAKAAVSDVETALLVSRTASKQNAFGPYTALVVSDSEDTLSGVQGTFDSIQPPDARADALRTQLDGLLGDALSDVANVRIAARRGDVSQLRSLARPLTEDARKLAAFMDANQ
jgi:hypothetical protein